MIETDILLLLLRVLGVLALLGFFAQLLRLLRRDVRGITQMMEASRRSYGRLIRLIEVDDGLLPDGQAYALLPLTTIGRNPVNTIMVEDTFASSEHARIVLRDGRWWLEDQHSRNGTLLNEILITEPVILTEGDVIGVGAFRFRLELD